jgi:hypothetical protein
LITDLLDSYTDMSAERKVDVDNLIADRSAARLWFPTVGPQLDAVNCQADVLLYGGSGGCGKTDLILGLAVEYHQRTLIIRKHYTDLTAIMDRAKEINGTEKGFKGSIPPRLRTVNKKLIDFGGLAKATDHEHWQGQAHDLLCVDEVVQNREDQIRFLMGWVRSNDPNQRCRTVFASNPPVNSAGDWIIRMFGPWLDTNFPKGYNLHGEYRPPPAKPGELRWCVSDEDGKDMWVEGPDVKIDSGRRHADGSIRYLIPTSRTFIPGTLADNPFYADTNYAAQLDALPEPLRSAIRDGNFMAARQDDADQVIPTEWVRRAQGRWSRQPPYGVPMSAMGVDGARGDDEVAIAYRHGGWYAPIIAAKGRTIATKGNLPHGTDLAGHVIKHHRHDAVIVFDAGETTGAQAHGHLKEKGMQSFAHLGVDKSIRRTDDGKMRFFNKRAEMIWRFREALDPGQDGGSPIALPDDAMLVSDLTAVKWTLTPQGIKVTPKKDVVKELGRSPDRGDAVMMAWMHGDKSMGWDAEWRPDQRGGRLGRKRQPVVNMGPRRRHQ